MFFYFEWELQRGVRCCRQFPYLFYILYIYKSTISFTNY